MPFKKGLIPHNKGKKLNKTTGEFGSTVVYLKICPACGKEISTKRESQVYCNLSCYAKSEKLKDFAKESQMIKNNRIKKYHLGFKHSAETKQKILNHPRRYSFPKGNKNPGFNKSKETIKKIKEKRLFQKILKEDTKPERIIQELLKDLGVAFIKHKAIQDIEHKYQCDIFIEPNIVLECDGDYFHNYPLGREIDRIRTKELEEKGYKLLRFWEHEIKNNLGLCKNKIMETINEKREIS